MNRFTVPQMLELAARGLGRVDRDGIRGATLVSAEEITAMAMLLAIMGLEPIEPSSYTPSSKIPHTEGERA